MDGLSLSANGVAPAISNARGEAYVHITRK